MTRHKKGLSHKEILKSTENRTPDQQLLLPQRGEDQGAITHIKYLE